MKTPIEIDPAAAEAARQRVLARGRIIRSLDELAGPGADPDDPQDVDSFLAILDEERKAAIVTRSN